jgi:hypothetical protein
MGSGQRLPTLHSPLPSPRCFMYKRPRFLEELQAIREEMSRECDYDMDLFAEMVRSNQPPKRGPARNVRGVRQYVAPNEMAAKKSSHKKKP